MDLLTLLMTNRDSTEWDFICVTNVLFTTYKTQFPIGGVSAVSLPDYVKNSTAVVALHTDPRTSRAYDDRYCAFRALAFHNSPHRQSDVEKALKCLEGRTKYYLGKWLKHTSTSPEEFEGLSMDQIGDFEKLFSVDISVYMLEENLIATAVYISQEAFKNHMFLNIFEDHFSYITDFECYCKKYKCELCDRLFNDKANYNRHIKSCEGDVCKHVYPGGYFKNSCGIFDDLEQYGISVCENERYYPWYSFFDMEAMLKQLDDTSSDTAKLTWIREHVAISVSIAANITDHEHGECIVEPDKATLVSMLVDYLNDIALKVSRLAREKWHYVLEQLEALLAKWEPEESDGDEDNDDGAQHYGILDGFQGEEDLEFFLNLDSGEVPFEMDEEPSFTSNKVCKIMHNRLKSLKARFESFLDQMPVLTFNGSSYDLNLIKEYLPKYLCLSDPEEKSFVVKKNNKYLCISNRRLKFLDLTQYLAPGTSYENFLKSYEIAEKKAFFPYDYFTDIGKLDETCLPPMEAFYSELKKVNVLSAEYARYQMLLDKGMTPDKALKSMKLEKIPNTGEENYVWLQKLWKDEGMKTFADLLVYYNNTDVRPGLLAIEKMRQFYQDKGVCLFKSTISLPGVARLLLFRCAEKNKAYFALLGERDRDLHYKISKGIVGGASTIYRRFHEVGKTFIRNNPLKGVENIVGYDSNSLYLNALSREMPTGTPIRRHKKNGFKPEITHKHESMFHCLDYISLTENIAICHSKTRSTNSE